jgi:DNA repair protein RecN (Recombination protein N)
MLTQLRVKNYALIKDLVFEPGNSFNVITGETGAGKSILLGAMGLILGERTDSVAVKENEEKCIVEGFFDISNNNLQQWFDLNELDYSNDLIIRREILISGKSRAFINDTPAQLSQLKELGKFLIDIHSQHDNLDLFQKSFQFRVLDSYAGIESEQSEYFVQFETLKKINRKIIELEDSEKKGAEERDYKQFLFDELEAVNLIEGELPHLEDELLMLSNADQNVQTIAAIKNQLSESESAVLDQMALIRNQLNQVSKSDKRFEEIASKLDEAYYTIQDINLEIDRLTHSTHADPERLEWVNQRLTILHHLTTKHRNEDLIEKRNNLKLELDEYANLTEEIDRVKSEKDKIEDSCLQKAKIVSESRHSQCINLEKQINTMIEGLGMPGAKIKIEVSSRSNLELGTYGINDTNFLYSPAEGKSFNPIQNIASGGEISRVMLVLKAILANKNVMPTIIFDEIDAGVSGEVAFKMGKMLEEMSRNLQLITITHLPQIASKGKRHFYVYKKQINNSTVSDIKELNKDERISEIAEMMGGKSFGNSILESAKQLLSQ